MASPEFLLVDLPADGLVLSRHTLAVPGSQVDSIQEGPQTLDDVTASSHLVVLQGFAEPEFRALLDDMRRQYPDLKVLDEQPEARRWILRNRVLRSHVSARQVLFLGQMESEFGLYWTHIQDGRFQLRAEVRSATAAHQDGERLRALFRKAGIDAQVRVAALSDGELAVAHLLREMAALHAQ